MSGLAAWLLQKTQLCLLAHTLEKGTQGGAAPAPSLCAVREGAAQAWEVAQGFPALVLPPTPTTEEQQKELRFSKNKLL